VVSWDRRVPALISAPQARPPGDIIDRIARKYTGQPYPLRTNRIVLLIEADHAQAVTFG
jgi:hypothetical protein